MRENITIEQFREFKSRLKVILDRGESIYEAHIGDENFNYNEVEKQLIEEYLLIQNELLNYDLSSIPYDEWSDVELVSDEKYPIDFTGTNANIDFSLLVFSPYINYKSCNIRNIEKIGKIINSDNFDEDVVRNNPKYFIPSSFPDDIKNNIYSNNLSIDDLFSLSNEQFRELQTKNFMNCFDLTTKGLVDNIGLEKAMNLYANSPEEYKTILKIYSMLALGFEYNISTADFCDDFYKDIISTDISQLKDVFYSYLKKAIFDENRRGRILKVDDFPELFVKENQDLFLLGSEVDENLRNRYYTLQLTFDDVIKNYPLFRNIPVSRFCNDYEYDDFVSIFGEDGLKKVIEEYPEFIKYIYYGNLRYQFINFVRNNNLVLNNIVADFRSQLKEQLIPFFESYNQIKNKNQLMLYNPNLFTLDKKQKVVFDLFGIDNIRRLEEEYSFFEFGKNGDSYNSLGMLDLISEFFTRTNLKGAFKSAHIDFKDGTLSYDEFLNELAKCLDFMRKDEAFSFDDSYDFIQGKFRSEHPDIFMSLDCPNELRNAFYKNKINLDFLYNKKEYLKYLYDRNLSNTISANIKLMVPGFAGPNGNVIPNSVNFIDSYASKYGNEKLLNLLSKYGKILDGITISSLNGELEDETLIEEKIKAAIYAKIVKNNVNDKVYYSYLVDCYDFVDSYPDIFIDLSSLTSISEDEKKRLTDAFYTRRMKFEDIRKYPELVDILKNKNLEVPFSGINGGYSVSDLAFLRAFGNEKFLELCSKYGRYLNGLASEISKDVDFNSVDLDYNDVVNKIESIITRKCFNGQILYTPDDAPDFLKESYPKLFLSDEAPEELKRYFYNYGNNYPMSFEILREHKDWLHYLNDKEIITSFLKNRQLSTDIEKYFTFFGMDNGLKLGISRAETVREMIRTHKVDLMKDWYDKTGGKFIPDYVVMQNFRFEEADKFLVSGKNWSNLMRIGNFSQNAEARDALLKVAYSFGAFDHDQRGFKKLLDLLTGLPKKVDADKEYIFEQIDNQINQVRIGNTNESVDVTAFNELFSALRSENVEINLDEDIFSQIYRKNSDGSYTLTINGQNYPKTNRAVRNILEKYRDFPIVSPEKAHQLFSGFDLKYDPDFREFLVQNMDEVLSSSEYVGLVSKVQRQFSEIKAFNSNRFLTWDLAVSFVQTNKYNNIEIGNERVAEVSAIAGYSQADFNILQQIYNYGKQRTFSSIPRIESTTDMHGVKYSYEILRLDDPLAMAIGTLTDCCQELNNCAEVCMEHSMVDKNGRIFVIRDEDGNIVAQSWVWRNGDVLCFDNIEIPDKAFTRAKSSYDGLGRASFTDDVFEIYKQAGHELMDKDAVAYKKLLDEGKITEEQYESLRLGKITVGLGYNDIADSLRKHAVVDKSHVVGPLRFVPPVKLDRGLYTNDSVVQYVLEERENRKKSLGEMFSLYSDDFIEYTDATFNEKLLLTLEKLEMVTKDNPRYLDTSVSSNADSKHLVSEIVDNYGLNPSKSKIVMNPNLAIIYEDRGDSIKVADLLFNIVIDNDEQHMNIEEKVVIQMRLAFEQISGGKKIDISSLSPKQKEMYEKAMSLTDEIDIERGVEHAR